MFILVRSNTCALFRKDSKVKAQHCGESEPDPENLDNGIQEEVVY